MREQGIFEIYEETVDTTSEPGSVPLYDEGQGDQGGQYLYRYSLCVDTTASWSPWCSSSVVAGGKVVVRGLTVTAGSATITKGDALLTDLVSCTGPLDSEGRKDDRDTVLDNACYQLFDEQRGSHGGSGTQYPRNPHRRPPLLPSNPAGTSGIRSTGSTAR